MNKKMMWKVALVSTIFTALFWGIWFLIFHHVPVQFSVSRWWDIAVAPIWGALMVALATQDDFSKFCLSWYAAIFVIIGLGVGLTIGLIVGVAIFLFCATLVVSLLGLLVGISRFFEWLHYRTAWVNLIAWIKQINQTKLIRWIKA